MCLLASFNWCFFVVKYYTLNLIVSLHRTPPPTHVTETRRVFATGLNDCGQLGVSHVTTHALVCYIGQKRL